MQTLELSGNAFGFKGAEALATALHENGRLTITHLFLSGGETAVNVGPEGGICILKALAGRAGRFESSLIELQLEHNNITNKAAESLKELLENCTTLQTLNLRQNRLARGAELFAEGLRKSKTLANLNLAANSLEHRDFLDLFKALSEKHSLQEFDLRFNSMVASAAWKECENAIAANPLLIVKLK